MGHFSHCCKLSGVPITGGEPVVLIVMKPSTNMYENSEEKLRNFGTTYMCSNEGTRLKYNPIWFPIYGNYDDYGGIENIVKDDNTTILEKYYDLTIEQLCAIITSGRKDDGYDEALDIIKIPVEKPEWQNEGEKHFDAYQRINNDPMPFGNGMYPDVSGKTIKQWQEKGYDGWTVIRDGKRVKVTKEEYDADFKLIHEHYARYKEWKKEFPDYEDDHRKPQYQEKYKELLTYSGMWVHRTVFERLTETPKLDKCDNIKLGTVGFLQSVGFRKLDKKGVGRYDQLFKKENLIIYSDGTWLENSIYWIEDFAKYCSKNGCQIDISEHLKKDLWEQIFDYILPSIESIGVIKKELSEEEKKEIIDKFKISLENENEDVKKAFKHLSDKQIIRMHSDDLVDIAGKREHEFIKYYFLSGDFRSGRLETNLPITYFNAAKEGKLRDNFVRFWRFDRILFANGRYYEIVGTSPQDGDHEKVLKVLEIAIDVVKQQINEEKQ